MPELLEYTPVTLDKSYHEYFTPLYFEQPIVSYNIPISTESVSEDGENNPKHSKEKFRFTFNESEEQLLNYTPVQYEGQPTQQTNTRVQTSSKKYSRGNLRAEILLLLERELGWKHGRDFNLGEAIRPKNANYGVKNSYHYTGNAVDLTPRGDMTFLKMKQAMLANANVRRFFLENGLGILDESTNAKRSRNNWTSTGNHFHIGPDSGAVRTWNSWITSAGFAKKGGVLKAYFGTSVPEVPILDYESVELPKKSGITDILDPVGLLENMSIGIPIYNSIVPIQNLRNPYELTISRAKGAVNEPNKPRLTFNESQDPSSQIVASLNQPSSHSFVIGDTSISNNTEFSTSFLDRIIQQESGGNYKAVGREVKGDRAYGLYLIMWNNVKRYSKYSKEEFLQDPREQRRVAELVARELWNQLTEQDKRLAARKGMSRDQMLAAMWFSGVGGFRKYIAGIKDSSDRNKKVSQYIKDLT